MAVLVVLVVARAVSTVSTVRAFWEPQILCRSYRGLYNQIGTESAMRTAMTVLNLVPR